MGKNKKSETFGQGPSEKKDETKYWQQNTSNIFGFRPDVFNAKPKYAIKIGNGKINRFVVSYHFDIIDSLFHFRAIQLMDVCRNEKEMAPKMKMIHWEETRNVIHEYCQPFIIPGIISYYLHFCFYFLI